MARGEESLRLELARRAVPEDEHDAISAPPGPTRVRKLFVIGVLGLLVIGAVRMLLRGVRE